MPRKSARQKSAVAAAAASRVAREENARRKTLKRKRGELISYKETRAMLSHYYSVRRVEKLRHTVSLSVTAERLGFGVNSVKRAVSSFEEKGEIVINSGKGRGGSCRNKLDHDTEARIAKKVQELNATTSRVTTVELQKWLKSEPDESDDFDKDREPVVVTAQTVGRCLKRLGYEFRSATWSVVL